MLVENCLQSNQFVNVAENYLEANQLVIPGSDYNILFVFQQWSPHQNMQLDSLKNVLPQLCRETGNIAMSHANVDVHSFCAM